MTITTTVTCDLCGHVIDDPEHWAAPVIFPYGKIGWPVGGFLARDAGTHKLYFHLSLDGLGCYDEFVRALCIALGGESRAKQTPVRKLERGSTKIRGAASKRELEAAR
jgi:hypothetical protein